MKSYHLISGSNRQAFKLDEKGPKSKPKILWSLKNFEARSAPFVKDNVLYISKSEGLIAIDAQTGKTKWEIKTPGQVTAPTIVDEMLLFGGHYIDDFLYGVDKSTGKEIFRFRTGQGSAGVHKSPVVEDGKIIFAAGKTIYALDLESKKVVWKVKTTDGVDHSPVTTGKGMVFKTTLSSSMKSKIYGASIADGKEICKIGLKVKCTSTILFHQDHLLYLDQENNLNILNPLSEAIQTMKVVEGKHPRYKSYLALEGDNLIIGIGSTCANLNLNTWQWAWVHNSQSSIGQPIVADGVVYFATCAESIYAIDFNTGKELFHCKTEVRSEYSCSVENETLYMAGSMNEHELIAFRS